jgi:hypothetical protein
VSMWAVTMVKLKQLTFEIRPVGPSCHRQAHYEQGGQHDHAEVVWLISRFLLSQVDTC